MAGADAERIDGGFVVHIDRNQPEAIDAPTALAATDDFVIRIRNAGEPVHFHLGCDDDLGPALNLETGNHFIHRDGTYEVPVEILADRRPVRGRFRFSVGYGAETAYTELRVIDPDPSEQVRVDESLAEPPTRDPPTDDTDLTYDPITFLLVGVGIAALLAAIVLVGMLTEPIIGVLLALAVVVVAAAAFVFRELS